MATYKQIQNFIKEKYDCSIKTCWIADVKGDLGIPKRKAFNRISETSIKHPCPKKHKEKIIEAFTYFKMIDDGA